jgi:hypothetical protein
MVRLLQKSKRYLAGGLIAAFGVVSTFWALWAWRMLSAEGDIAVSARRILLGESFKSAQLSALKLQIESLPSDRLRPRVINGIAVIRLRMFENEHNSGNRRASASALAELNAALRSALSSDPGNSFLWLAGYWLQDPAIRTSDYGRGLLSRSYLLGPYEGWIAAKRNPLALGIFFSLPNELSEKVGSEFVALVRSALYSEAVDGLTVATEPVRQNMLARLARVSEENRKGFAREVRRRDLHWLVPGVIEPIPRPF